MTETILSTEGRPLSKRGLDTRRRLLDAAEQVFGALGYHDASVVKVAEAAGVATGTFYLYFDSKKAVFDELMVDLNRRIRHAMTEGASRGTTRIEAELLGFQAYFQFTREHPALYRIIRQSEFVSPELLHYHYSRVAERYVEALEQAMERGEVTTLNPEVTAWALMGLGELVGMRWILWADRGPLPPEVWADLERIIRRILEVEAPQE